MSKRSNKGAVVRKEMNLTGADKVIILFARGLSGSRIAKYLGWTTQEVEEVRRSRLINMNEMLTELKMLRREVSDLREKVMFAKKVFDLFKVDHKL